MKLELEASGVSLHLETNEVEWCRVSLQLHDRRIVLGAEMRKAVVARMMNGLADTLSGKVAGHVDGVPARWVLSLSEEHSTVYAADVDEGRRLYFQDRDAKWIATVTLSPEDRRRWLSLLQRVA